MNYTAFRRLAQGGIFGLAIAALGACSTETPAAPGIDGPSFGSIPGGGTGTATTNVLAPEAFKVCKVYSGADGGPVTIRVQIDAGNNASVEHDFNISLGGGECRFIWSTDGNLEVTDLITLTETGPAGYTVSYDINTLQDGVTTDGAPVASNTASQTITNPNGTGVDGVVVTFTNTENATGCTLTQGYWKTHSLLGPAPYDNDWLNVGAGGSSTLFFTSGKTWFTIFWTPPAGGNAYLQLAHQYMAAKLNVLAGAATTPAVVAAISAAETYFAGKAAGVTTETNAATKTLIKGYASTLGQYNEGAIGPGHCDEAEPLPPA